MSTSSQFRFISQKLRIMTFSSFSTDFFVPRSGIWPKELLVAATTIIGSRAVMYRFVVAGKVVFSTLAVELFETNFTGHEFSGIAWNSWEWKLIHLHELLLRFGKSHTSECRYEWTRPFLLKFISIKRVFYWNLTHYIWTVA